MYPYAETYFTIYVCGTFTSFLGCGLNQFILAQGFARQGIISVALGAVVNMVLDPVLIFGCGMGIAGAAWGTVIAQCCTCVYVICFLRSRIFPVCLCPGRLQKKIVLRILSIGCMSFMIMILDNLIIIFLKYFVTKIRRRFAGGYIDYLCYGYSEFYDDSSLSCTGDHNRMWNDIQLSLWGRKLYKDPAGFSLCVFIMRSIHRSIGNCSAGITGGVCRSFLEGVRHNIVGRGQYPYVYVCIAWYCSTVCPGRWPDCNGKGQICASIVTVS